MLLNDEKEQGAFVFDEVVQHLKLFSRNRAVRQSLQKRLHAFVPVICERGEPQERQAQKISISACQG